MKQANVLLVFCSSLLIDCVVAAVRSEIIYHHYRRRFPSNTSTEIAQHGLSTAESSTTRAALPELTDPTTRHDVLSISETASMPAANNTISNSLPSSASTSVTSLPSNVRITGAEVDDDERITSPSATDDIRNTEGPSHVSTTSSSVDSIITCGNGDTSECSSVASESTKESSITLSTSSSLLQSTSSTEPCTPLPSDKAVTEYSIVYTSTITFYGSSADYTPPYSPIETPNYCPPAGDALITFFSTTRISNSTSTLIALATPLASPPYDPFMPDLLPPTFSIDLPETITQTPNAVGKGGGGVIVTMRPFLSFSRHVITFITTDKNPSVVFSPEPTAVFSQTLVTGNAGDGRHNTVGETDISQSHTPTYDVLESVKQLPVPTYHLTAGGEQVIINNKTISNLGPDQTTIVTVENEIFTILPTAILWLSSTITKPAPQATSPPIPVATSRTLGGIPVIVSGTQIAIDGTTLRIPSQKITTSINGQSVVLGAGTIAVGLETLILPSPQPTHEIVTGGEILTAIGTSLVIIHSTTITYGLNISPIQTTINGETISIDPKGVSLHGTTIGGSLANVKATEYEIVGGITVGKLLPSLVVVNGATYTINQDGNPKNLETIVIDHQTITIGPRGLVVSSQTLTYPASSITAILSPSGTFTNGFPVETGGLEDDDESGASSGSGDVAMNVLMCFCFIMSVCILV